MTPNMDSKGIRYGYISARSLHPDVVDELCYGSQATDVYYEEACTELADAIRYAVSDFLTRNQAQSLIDDALEMFEYEGEEPVHEGEYEGIKYRTSWLGGALNVWIFESPVTGLYQECSPCVPGAGNLDCPDEEGVLTYDVPKEWRDENK